MQADILGLHPWRSDHRKQGIRTASSCLTVHRVFVQRDVSSPLAFSPGSFTSKVVQVSSVFSNGARLSLSNTAGDFKPGRLDLHRELVSTYHRLLGGWSTYGWLISPSLASSFGLLCVPQSLVFRKEQQNILLLNTRNFTCFTWVQMRLESIRKMVSEIISRVSSKKSA